jgi:chemotaxis signal transduction protein
MTANAERLAARLTQLRTAFDQSFAKPTAGASARLEHVLAIRVGGRPYAVRLSEVAGVYTGWSVMPVPGPRPELLGIAGHRGELVPVYDLAALLGTGGDTARADGGDAGRSRWTMLTVGTEPVAFRFDRPDGHLRMSPDALAPPGSTGPAWAVVEAAGASWTVVTLARLVAAIQPDRAGGAPPPAQDTGSEQP